MKSKFTPRPLVAALALSLGLAGAGAALAFGPGQGHERCSGRMEHGMTQGLRGMERLHDELKLDARQEALWQEARQSMRGMAGDKDARNAMRERMQKQRSDALAALSQPGADLRGLMQQMDAQRDEMRDAMRKQHEASRDRWLAVYDSLNPEQKEKARLFFKSKLERMDGKMRGPRSGGPGPQG